MSLRSFLAQDAVANLKKRKQIMLGTQYSIESLPTKQHNKGTYGHTPNKDTMSSFLIKQINDINFSSSHHKSLLIHIHNSQFSQSQKITQLQNFLQAYLSHSQLHQLAQIKIINDYSTKFISSQRKQFKHLPTNPSNQGVQSEKTLIKLNLKYCANSRKQDHHSEDQINAYVFPISLIERQGQHIMLLKHSIDWDSNPYIIILQNSYSQNKNDSYKLYFVLLKSFFQYQTNLKNYRSQLRASQLVPPIVKINKLQDLIEQGIFSSLTGNCNFQKLCQLQYNLFKVETQLKISESRQTLRLSFIEAYRQKLFKSSVLEMAKFMKFYNQRKTNLAIKYFNLWSLVTCESVLNKVDCEIVDQKYCQSKYLKQLKKKVFIAWKLYFLQFQS